MIKFIKKLFGKAKKEIKEKLVIEFSKAVKIIKSLISKKIEYPCEDCLILPLGCRQLCEKVEMDNEKLKETMIKAGEIDGGLHCPDCGCTEWYEGPHGGLSINCKCAKCGHWFNLAPNLMCFQRVNYDPRNRRIYD